MTEKLNSQYKDYKIESFPNMDFPEERNHVITKEDCTLIVSKIKELSKDAFDGDDFIFLEGMTLLEATSAMQSIEQNPISHKKLFCIFLSALWPERFELIENK